MTIQSIEVAINGRHLEASAKVEILPGMLLERYEDGVRPHSVEGGTAPPLIAVENKFAGSDIHTPYEVGDTVYIRYCLPGDVFWGRSNLLLPINDFLISYGGVSPGKLKVAPTPTSSGVVGRGIAVFEFLPGDIFFVKVEIF